MTEPLSAPGLRSWPATLWLVRHGQSAGNVARDAAEASGLDQIAIAGRDVDVPLSPLGERQARALGRWFGELAPSDRPTVVLTSPFVRAMQTAAAIVEEGRLEEGPLAHVVDERLREKEFGALDALTKAGIAARFPHEVDLRDKLGKLYYRPPGGESWCDVILRLRSVLDHVQLQYRRERVLLVAHQVVVLCCRYVLEDLDEARILAIDRERDVANCSVTEYVLTRDADGRESMALQRYNDVTPLADAGAPITKRPDPDLPR